MESAKNSANSFAAALDAVVNETPPKRGRSPSFSRSFTVKHCLMSGERCVIEPGPTWEDRRLGFWRYYCPSCMGFHQEDFMPRARYHDGSKFRELDISFEVDMGELMCGHHIVARGLQLRTPFGSMLHYDCVPAVRGATEPDLDMSWGLGDVFDDVGTLYRRPDHGEWFLNTDADVNWGDWQLGNGIPAGAATLDVNYHQAHRGLPENPSTQILHVDLVTGDASVRRH
jgi:hypothetical protein